MRGKFFALAVLPFCATAKDPVPEAAPAIITASEAFIPSVIDTFTNIPVGINPTSTDAIVVPQSTSAAFQENPEPTNQPAPIVQDTKTFQDIVRAPTIEEPPPVLDTTTGPVLVIDTTQPNAQEGATQPHVQDTTTGQPTVENRTSQQVPALHDTTTELSLSVDLTTTWHPVVDTTSQPISQTPGSSQEPVGQDTTTDVQLPVVPTTIPTTVPGVTTETNNRLPDTTTQQQPATERTTTVVSLAETTTAQVPVQDSITTAAEQPAQTTTQDQEPKPTTEKFKPNTKDDGEPVITQPPAQTTVAPEVAKSSVFSVSSQVAALIPIINKWTEDPESLTDDTNKEVEGTHDDIIAVIVLLSGKPDVGCNKQGVLGPIGDIINKLACMAQDLTNISGSIIAGNVPAVTNVVTQVQSQNDDLTEKNEENQSQGEQRKEESAKQEETTKKEPLTSREELTTTEATIVNTGLPQPCGTDTCGGSSGGGSCPIGSGGWKGGHMGSVGGDINCNDLSTTTVDGPLPTDPSKPIDVGGDPFTAPTARSESESTPSKRDIELVARAFDDDTSPNPLYVASLNPLWVDQTGATAGHWFYAPPFAGKGSAGVNGIYGCTSVIVVSNLGAYVSHIWENPVFIDSNWNTTPDDKFQATTFNALRDGTPDGNAESIAGYVGTDQVPGVLHSMFHPRVFVVTPFTNDLERSLGVTTTFRYEDRANYLAATVSGIVPGSDSTVLGYTRTDHIESTKQYGTWGRAIIEYDMLEEIVFGSDSDITGQFMGRWRLWVEDQLVTSHKFLVFPDPIDLPAAGLQKRAEDETASKCLVRGVSADAATTVESTSVTKAEIVEPTTSADTEESTTDVPFFVTSTATTFSTVISISSDKPSSTSSESEESRSSTQTKPYVRTVTTDGAICTLIEGSLDPICHPISTPTPNPDGTNVHVNWGCILINGFPRCDSDAGSISNVYESSYNVASSPGETYNTVLILSGFDSSNDNHLHAKPTCQLQARWPANYGDIYFGEDGCLYDSQSNKIYNQCCSPPDSNNSGPTTNPYCPPAPLDSEQDHGDHDGSAICASISKDTCLSAAMRYVDDVVYHQYTSAVWPDNAGKDIANAVFPITGSIIEDLFSINYGCTVIWTCDNDDAFTQGMTGRQIKDSMINIYSLNGAKGCGSTYLENGCHITVNGCNDCRDYGHSQTLWSPIDVYYGTFDDANDGFPPRRRV
ncbi:hypothetical protein ACKAV7_012025 [Fusarium commune]